MLAALLPFGNLYIYTASPSSIVLSAQNKIYHSTSTGPHIFLSFLFSFSMSVSQMAPPSSHSNTVCVMDASGHLGSRLVESLLQRGYTVHAAVQSHGEQFDGISCDKEKLKVFHSDPFDYQSLVDALRGCSGLFYNFEPPQDQPTYDEFMAEVEVRAAHNVLEACAQTETIDKVVFTSSITAVVWRQDVKSSPYDLDENHWSDVNLCRNFKLWYALSKTVAEKTAWALAMDRTVNMVSVNAGLLLSPDLSISHPYMKGTAEMYEDGTFVTVDLDYLVDAHICVYEDVSSYGRYLCFNHVINRPEDAYELARKLTVPAPPAQSYEQDKRIIQQRISNKKLNKLHLGDAAQSEEVESSFHVANSRFKVESVIRADILCDL